MEDKYFYGNEAKLRTFALLHGIDKIVVTFSGGGDSGQIDHTEVTCNGVPFDKRTPITVAVKKPNSFNKETKKWEQGEIEEKAITLEELLDEHVYEALGRTDVDWYNNEGGQGHWEWNPSVGVSFLVEYNVVTTEVGHDENRELGQSPATF